MEIKNYVKQSKVTIMSTYDYNEDNIPLGMYPIIRARSSSLRVIPARSSSLDEDILLALKKISLRRMLIKSHVKRTIEKANKELYEDEECDFRKVYVKFG